MLKANKKLLVLFLAFVGIMLIGLAGCASEESDQPEEVAEAEPAPEQPEEPTTPEPSILNIATHPTGSLHNVLGIAYATVLDNHLNNTFHVIATSGPVESFPLIPTGDIHMIAINNWDAMMGWKGDSVYEELNPEGYPLRLVFESIYFYLSGLVPKDSDLWEPEDFIGKRVGAIVEASPAVTQQGLAVWANLGVLDDVILESYATTGDHVVALREGRVDATFCAAGMPVVEEAHATIGIRMVNLDPSPEAVERMQEQFPAVIVQLGPEDNIVGIEEPTYVAAYRSYLICAGDLGEELVYNMTKVIVENFDEMRPAHGLLAALDIKDVVTETFTIPYHEGAVRYFKEAGMWTPLMEDRQQDLLQQGI